MEQKNKKIISILVEDEFGALSRIIELFGEGKSRCIFFKCVCQFFSCSGFAILVIALRKVFASHCTFQIYFFDFF